MSGPRRRAPLTQREVISRDSNARIWDKIRLLGFTRYTTVIHINFATRRVMQADVPDSELFRSQLSSYAFF